MKTVGKFYGFVVLTIVALVASAGAQPTFTLPLADGSVRLAVIGDAGRGNRDQNELGGVMTDYRRAFPFELVLTTGDNIYGGDSPRDLAKKFELPYKALLDAGVKFYASLGNHDDANAQRNYPLFNMGGQNYYRFERNGVSFYSLDSNDLDQAQITWLISTLAADPNRWRIAFFHHPPFSSGRRHGSIIPVRSLLHPIFVANGVDVVFTGHDHFYERIMPQEGIAYFVTGAGGKIRKGNIRRDSPLTAAGFDTDLSFMLVEFAGDDMHFQVISKGRTTVDSGVVKRRD